MSVLRVKSGLAVSKSEYEFWFDVLIFGMLEIENSSLYPDPLGSLDSYHKSRHRRMLGLLALHWQKFTRTGDKFSLV